MTTEMRETRAAQGQTHMEKVLVELGRCSLVRTDGVAEQENILERSEYVSMRAGL